MVAMKELRGKVALVTGGGSGINLAFVKLLYEAGCSILIADLSLHPEATSWLASIQVPCSPAVAQDQNRVHYQRTDVTRREQLEAAFDVCQEKFAVPDIVVPGAGIYEPSHNSFWADDDEASHYQILDVNLVHPIKTTRIAIRRMLGAGKGGYVVHVSSVSGQRSSIVTPLYTASKHGISSFIRGMAPLHDLAGIKIVGVAPGTIGTPLFTEHPEAAKFLDMEKDCLLSPDVVAQAMLALVTNDDYKPGTILEVCDVENWREVSLLNDPGPSGPASFTRRKLDHIELIRVLLEKERHPA